jgi:hypothetical protein
LALYSSDRTASSPLTAYFASLTWGLMLLMFKLRRGVVVDILRVDGCHEFKGEGGKVCRLSRNIRSQRRRAIQWEMRDIKYFGSRKKEV